MSTVNLITGPGEMHPWRWNAILGFAIILALYFAAATSNWSEVVVGGQYYFVDADCYSRMTRVVSILEGGPWSIRAHDFENWPVGTRPHTTAPLDLLIVSLALVFGLFEQTAANAADIAGAWISPLLGATMLVFLWVWSGWMRMRGRWMMLLVLAVSPVVVQAFKFGRPDHQSLVMLMLAAGLAAEVTMWRRPGVRSAVLWGAAWAVALWVSLFEPLIIFTVLLILRIALLRGAALAKNWRIGWLVWLGAYSLAVIADGWRVFPGEDPAIAEFFPRWASMLGELMPVPLFSGVWFAWAGFGLLILPVLLVVRILRERDRTALLWLVLGVGTFVLTAWQLRWASYFILIVGMSLPFVFEGFRRRTLLWCGAALVLSLWPVAAEWERLLYPSTATAQRLAEQQLENVQLRAVAEKMRATDAPGGFLAPWWLSPALAYWSGQPGLSGSSHQSLSGIADSSRFFLASDPVAAREILEERRVTFVVMDDPSRMLKTAARLLGVSPESATRPNQDFDGLQLTPVLDTGFYQLYRAD